MYEKVTKENWAVHLHRVHREMTALVHPSVASLSRTRDRVRGDAAGSGVYVTMLARPYLLTCEHVISQTALAGYSLTHQPKTGDYYHALPHPWFMEPPPIDLAVTFIDPASWTLGDRTGVPVELFPEQYAAAEHELLFVAGHPGELAKFQAIPGEEGLKSDRLLYIARECPLPSGYDPALHFAVEYEMTKAKATDGSSRKLPAPPGLSGSAIWDTGFTAAAHSDNWNAAQARIVGIAQRWDRDHSCVVATKAEAIRAFLLEQLTGDFAYHHWVGRGRPEYGIADVDIQYAESIVTDLKSAK